MRTTSGAIKIVIGAFVVGGVLAACASGMAHAPVGDDDDDGGAPVIDGGTKTPGVTSLTIAPAMCDLTIENGAAAHQAFTLTAGFSDGTQRDVTAEAQFGADPARGAFT